MKKLFAIMLAATLLALSLTSCGKASFSYMEEDLTKYVTAGDYLDLTVTMPATPEVSDEEVKNHAVEHLSHSEDMPTLESGTAEMGSLVNIDFVGTMNGEAFEGGTAENQNALLGAGGFIDGFEDGIVGMAIGETKTIDVTFPEDYSSEDLAGKDAKFEITLNKIYDGEAVLGMVRIELEESREATIEANKSRYAWTEVVKNATVSAYPESAVKALADDLYSYYEAAYYSYTQYGITLENLGITKESCRESAENTFKEEMVLYSIVKANADKYTITEEEFDAKVASLAEAQEISSAEYLRHYSRQSVETKIYYEKVMADVISTATFIEE